MKYRSFLFRYIFLAAAFAVFQHNSFSQSRLYISAGLSGNTGGPNHFLMNYENLLGYKYLSVDWEERIVGSFYLLPGLSYYDIGYKSDTRAYGSAIEFKGSYLSVPILARWNVRNLNTIYVDMGLSPSYLVYAHLEESIIEWHSLKVVEGDVTPHLNRLYFYFQLQGTIAIRRFLITGFWMVPFNGQNTVKDLEEHWGLNKQQSTYLLHPDYLGYIYGFKIGYRVK